MAELRKIAVSRELLIPIVHDGAIAGAIADGRLLPVLLIDTSERPDVRELLRVHEHLGSGDVEFDWGLSLESKDDVILHLRFLRPMEVHVLLLFDVRHQAILVEGILSGGGIYLQDARPGDRLSTTLDAHRVLIELPDTGFRAVWDPHLLERTTALLRKRGIPRRSAPHAAAALIHDLKEMASFRVRVGAAPRPNEPGTLRED
jgi:hypothetical protein